MKNHNTCLMSRWNCQEFRVRFSRSRTFIYVFKVNRMQLCFLHCYIWQEVYSDCCY